MNREDRMKKITLNDPETRVLPPSSVGGCRVTCSCARVWGPDFERRSSFDDAGWADHTVPDVQRHLGVHADILINGVRRHRQAS